MDGATYLAGFEARRWILKTTATARPSRGAEDEETLRRTDLSIELIDRRRGDADKDRWAPFELAGDFEPRWWMLRDFGLLCDPWFVQVVRDGDEVARVELDEKVSLEGYLGPSGLPGPAPLEIQFIEVSPRLRRQGVGAAVIAALSARHPDRRLVAFSEDADAFWSGVGWERHEHPSGRNYRPLYVQPLPNMDETAAVGGSSCGVFADRVAHGLAANDG